MYPFKFRNELAEYQQYEVLFIYSMFKTEILKDMSLDMIKQGCYAQ